MAIANVEIEHLETQMATDSVIDAEFVYRSWPFQLAARLRAGIDNLVGYGTLALAIAVVSNIPLLQLASFGFLLDVSGRVARSGRLRDGFAGIKAAAVAGRGLLGTAICLVPSLLIGQYWYAAYLIDPTSPQTKALRIVQLSVALFTFLHIVTAWFCGGRFRYFVWPLLAPVTLSIWVMHNATASRWVHPLIRVLSYPFSKSLAAELLHVPDLKNWFLPAIVWDRLRTRRFWSGAADGLWNFFAQIPMLRLFGLGLIGFLGSFVWLLLPTVLMIAGTSRATGGAALLSIVGALLSTIVFSFLLLMQTEFAASGDWRDFFRFHLVWRRLRSAPIWHVIAVLLTLVLALPLFLLKIEEIPNELKWSLSLVFVLTGWLSRVMLGWANARARKAPSVRRWWWGVPVSSLILPLSFAFVIILFFTRYISWHGVWSLLENPVFLLPAPFWL